MDRVLKAARASGSLNLSNRSLRDVPDEVYTSLNALGEGEKWWESVELQKLILAHNSIETLKEDLRNLSQLTVLNVSNNKLHELPSAIGELPMLKSLDVSFNLITKIPDEIGSATSLVKLDCSSNKLSELLASLGRCVDLADLKAAKNCINSLPDELANCSKLTKLDVEINIGVCRSSELKILTNNQGNKLNILSGNLVASWAKLTELNAAKNMLSGLPDNLGNLSKLIRLDLHQNKIASIPPSIEGCSSLAELYLGNNSLSSLPDEIRALGCLATLDLHSNQLKEYPIEACKLSLSLLDLSNNSLSGLPPEIGKFSFCFLLVIAFLLLFIFDLLTNLLTHEENVIACKLGDEFICCAGNMTTLRKVLLNGNPIRTIRSSLVSGPTPTLLKFLRSRLPQNGGSESSTSAKEDIVATAARLSLGSKELSLEGLGLSDVPSKAWESGEIVKLDLSRNSIQELPVELSTCASIQSLILSKNKIKEWPGSVLNSLSSLSCLKLDFNGLEQIPADAFQAVPMLQILDLSCNPSSLSRNPAFSSLQHLHELYLRRVQLREIPSDILSLKQLQILYLSQNSIESIPVEFKHFVHLTEFDLSDNNISVLPAELGLLEPTLQVLRLDGNPLRSIRRPILERGTKAVLQYLKDKLPEQQ
ncbi:Plant intracellular Ras-group-related LRR protein 6 [Linum perenne]